MSEDKYTGPQTLPAEMFDKAIALANKVFRSSSSDDMGVQFPRLYRRDHLEQLRVFTDQDGPVALVGMVTEDVVALGCSVRIVSIGSVCTAESARGQGLAGALMDNAVEQAIASEAGLMLISGGRTLYTRRGADSLGLFYRYRWDVEQVEPCDAIRIIEITPDRYEEALKLFEAEAIHYRRSVADYAEQVECAWYLNGPGRTYLIERDGVCTAVASITPSRRDKECLLIAECAGSRRDLIAASGQLAATSELSKIVMDSYTSDHDLGQVLEPMGVVREDVSHSGVLKLLDVNILWRQFLPLITERIGASASDISVRADADELKIHTVTFELGSESITITGSSNVLAVLFGGLKLDPLADESGLLADLLRKALPLPVPMYGLNYV